MEKKSVCCVLSQRLQSLPFEQEKEKAGYRKLKDMLRQELERLVTGQKVRLFMTDMSAGLGLVMAELILELREKYPELMLESVIPYEEQTAGWTENWRDRYYMVASQCGKETMLQTHYTRDCMKKCRHYMVDNSEYVLAVWDGNRRTSAGQAVCYAEDCGREICIIHPDTTEFVRKKQPNNAQA